MPKTINYGDAEPRTEKNWGFIIALEAFDLGDRKPLGDMLRKRKKIPKEFREPIAEIILGNRKPNMRANAKLAIAPYEMLTAGTILSLLLSMLEWHKSGLHIDLEYGEDGYLEKSDFLADKYRVEKIVVTEQVESASLDAVKECADKYDVSVETVENWLRRIRKLIHQYNKK